MYERQKTVQRAYTVNVMFYSGDSQTVHRGVLGRRGIFQNVVFSVNFYVLFLQTATEFLGQIVINLFGPNYLISGSVRYFFRPRGAVKNC